MSYMRVGDLLKSAGLITDEQLQRALDIQKSTKQGIGAVLVGMGVITEDKLVEVMSSQLGVSYIDLTKTNIPIEMARNLPKNIAKRHLVVPVSVTDDEIVLAMVDPLNFLAIEDVRAATRKRVSPRIATATAVERAIATLYGNDGAARAIDEIRTESGAAFTSERSDIIDISSDSETSSAPTVRLVNSIIERAVNERASDIHFEPRAGDMAVRMRVDGILRSVLTVPRDVMSSVISRIKVMSNLDLADHRTPKDGRANVSVSGRVIDLRVSTLPTIYGEKAAIRLLDKSEHIRDPELLGLYGENLSKYNALLKNTDGMVLLVGPTGSGKSSTMYTMINRLNTDEVNLVTLEDPVEYDIDGVNQVQINDKTGMTFANGLRAILRQDPDIVAIGEIRDAETAEIALRAAITGHLVLSTVHTNSAVSLLDRLLDIGCEPYLIAEALKGVISQRLVRKICPYCREEYLAGDDELRTLGIKSDGEVKLYRGKGCPYCYHTGYRGRTAVFEVMMLSSAEKRLIADNRPRSELIDLLAKEGGFRTLSENCAELVLNGTTSLSEMVRVIYSTERGTVL